MSSVLSRNSGLDAAAFTGLHNSVKRGDIVGIEGYAGKSKRGELSIFPTRFVVLSPCLHMLPVAHTGLKSQVRAPSSIAGAGRAWNSGIWRRAYL